MQTGELKTLAIAPVFELTRDGQAPPLQEGTFVEGQREPCLRRFASVRHFVVNAWRSLALRPFHELEGVYADVVSNPKVLSFGCDPILTEILTKPIEGLAKRVPGPIRSLIRPEDAGDAITGSLTLHGQIEEKTCPNGLLPEAAGPSFTDTDVQPAEGFDPDIHGPDSVVVGIDGRSNRPREDGVCVRI
jgi:hypothetical protein